MTLVEMLVVIAVTLILIFAVVQIFEVAGQAVQVGRATLEMAGQLRTVSNRLRMDLDGLTVPARPWPRSSSAMGYLQIREGSGSDSSPVGAPVIVSGTASTVDTTIGDWDDVLMFTAHAIDEPFTGRVRGTIVGSANPYEIIESRVAEIVWWVHFEDNNGNNTWDSDEELTLHRRVLLVRPDLNLTSLSANGFFNDNDVSAHPIDIGGGSIVMMANTLADLTKRENRFAHDARVVGGAAPSFPYPLITGALRQLVQTGNHEGEDVVLSHIVGFDVRVYDPTAPVYSDTVHALVPGDPGFATAAVAGSAIGRGAFVDLGYTAASSTFSGSPNSKSLLTTPTYCTWSFHYEHDGIDQDGSLFPAIPWRQIADTGTNGLDDDGANGVDDVGERETSPPYPVPLRGLQVTLRIVEHDSQQVRQVTIVSDFTPE